MKKIISFCFFLLQFSTVAQIGFEEHVAIDHTFGTPFPQAMAFGDINGDSYPDIVVGGTDKLAWYKNTDGLGNFSVTQLIEGNTYTIQSLAIGDLDNDNDLDVVYGYWGSNETKLYWQKNLDGLGTFGQPILLNTNDNYYMYIQIMDIDNDGDNDITANATNLVLYKNNGQGVFTDSSLGSYIDSFNITDITGDGLMDVITISGYDMHAKKQNIDGTFSFLQVMSNFAQAEKIYSADIDSDGDNDILTIYENGNIRNIRLYKNSNGLGTFTSQVLITLPNLNSASSEYDNGLDFTDFDGDGAIDILVRQAQLNQISWYKNTGNYSFGPEQIITNDALNARDAMAADVNGDEYQDIVAISIGDGNVAWYQNTNGLGGFSVAKMVSYNAYFVNNADVGDLNGDGTPDIISTSHADNKVAWYKNTDGEGDFSQPQLLISKTTSSARSGHARDMDGDGDLDVLYSYYLDSFPNDIFNIRWKENEGNGIFSTEHVIFVGPTMIYNLYTSDVDNDGDVDVIAVLDTANLMLLKNSGAGTFVQQLFTYPIGNLGYNSTLADVDGDGDVDVISKGSNKFAWYENVDGQGNFNTQHNILLSQYGPNRTLTTADLDGDGDQDILFIGSQNKVGWFENTDGNGVFGPEIIIATVIHPLSVLALDIDGDGDQDIVCDAEEGFRLRWFENSGNGVFNANYEISNNIDKVSSMKASDMDGDGDLDIVTSSYGDHKVAWFENLGPFENTLQGSVSLDINANGCDVSDLAVPNILITTTNGTNTFSTFTDAEGTYKLYTDEGNFNTNVTTPLTNYPANPVSQLTPFVGLNQTQIVNFCLEPMTSFNDLEVSLTPLNQARPGFVSKYRIHVKNNGTNPLEGMVTVAYNPTKFSFLTSNNPPAIQNSNSVSFDFTNINAFEILSIDLEFQVATLPTTAIGEILTFTATLDEVNSDTIPEDNTFLFNQMIVGAYDPNDIQVVEGSQIAIDDADKYLHYIIRFQNTGNFYAQNVVVTNELDEKLDWTTFQLESYSHSNRVEVVNGSMVNFIFDAIYLPGMVEDEIGSQGFIIYKIKPKPTVEVGNSISNNVLIYFDFNPPINTNTVYTEIVEFILSNPTFQNEMISIYPNPTSGMLTISTKDTILRTDVYNQLGQLILESAKTTSLNLSQFDPGVYFIKIVNTNNQVLVKKIIKQ